MNPVATVMLLFFLQPLAFGCILVRIPDIQLALDLNKAELSWALFSVAVGAMLMLPVASFCLNRLGERISLLIGFPAFTASLVLATLASNLPLLMGAFLLVGMSLAYSELGMNSYAVAVEQRSARHIMIRAHGCWSIGLLAGSFIGVQLAGGDFSVISATLMIGVPGLLPAIWLAGIVPRHKHSTPPTAAPVLPRSARLSVTMLGICLFIAGFAMAEGAMLDWSTVYLRELMGPDAVEAGYGLSIFAGCVAAGRFSGDWLKHLLGAVRLAQLCLTLAISGLLLIVSQISLLLVFAGFGLAGLGIAVGFPLAVSASAQVPGNRSANLAYVTLAAQIAFLVGPPSIGILAELTSLQVGLLILLPMLALSFYSTRWLR